MESISWRSILIHFNSFCISPSILIRFNSFYSSPSILLHFNSFYFSLSISIHSILVQANPYFGYFLGLPDLRTTVFSLRISLISSDRSSCTDDGLLYIHLYIYIYIRPLFQILSIYAFLYCYKCHSKSLKQYQCN